MLWCYSESCLSNLWNQYICGDVVVNLGKYIFYLWVSKWGDKIYFLYYDIWFYLFVRVYLLLIHLYILLEIWLGLVMSLQNLIVIWYLIIHIFLFLYCKHKLNFCTCFFGKLMSYLIDIVRAKLFDAFFRPFIHLNKLILMWFLLLRIWFTINGNNKK